MEKGRQGGEPAGRAGAFQGVESTERAMELLGIVDQTYGDKVESTSWSAVKALFL
ncbi:MAG: hypothetical protein ACLFR7_07165 [Opitutales bacterium]